MMTRLRLWLDNLRTSLWFIPSVIVAGSVALAYGLLALDAAMPAQWWQKIPWLERLFDVRQAGASAMLQVIGGSIITIAGVVFSITIAALTLASAQYTSRVLRNFIRDRANQAVLGTFLGIFVYCLLILRSLSGGSQASHTPPLSLAMALVLAFVGVAVLIFFIHHIVLGLQATNVVATIARDALPSIDRHFPRVHERDEKEPPVDLAPVATGPGHRICAAESGYVTGVDTATLIDAADKVDGLIRVRLGEGRFAAEGETIAELQTEQNVDDALVERIAGAWSFGTQRTLENDPAYGIRQLVDVALKALSPGVNETTTAVMCVNWLGVMLLRMNERRFPSRLLIHDAHVRVVDAVQGFDELLGKAFDQIRQCAAGNVAVMQRLLEVLQALAETDASRTQRIPLLRQVEAIEALALQSVPWAPDREGLLTAIQDLRFALGTA
ncbi:MAG: DUF2254 domain-containing protein [Rudaea sp.]